MVTQTPTNMPQFLRVQGYAFNVTPFATYNEAATARDVALDEQDDAESGSIRIEQGHYVVAMGDGVQVWYL